MLPPPTAVYGPHGFLPTPTGLCGPCAGPATSDVVSTRELEAKSRCQHLSMCLSSRHYRTFARTCILGLASRDNFSAICDFFLVAFLNIYRPRDSRRCRPRLRRACILRDPDVNRLLTSRDGCLGVAELADKRLQRRLSDTPGSARDLNGITEILRGDMFSRRVMFGCRGRGLGGAHTRARREWEAAARRRGEISSGFRRPAAKELKES